MTAEPARRPGRPTGMLRRALLVLAFVLLNATLGMRAAYACSCIERPSAEEAVARADVAFVGEITRRLGGEDYEVRVDGVLKGDVPAVTKVRVWSGGAASCGTTVDLGPLLYAADRPLQINQCTPRWHGADVAIAVAGLSRSPSPPAGATTAAPPTAGPLDPLASGAPRWAWPLAAAAVVGAGAALVLRARRSP